MSYADADAIRAVAGFLDARSLEPPPPLGF